MVAWRLLPMRHQGEAFSGKGARIAAGRWNSRGTRAVYLCGSLSLAALEMLVYAGRAALSLPLVFFRVEIPDGVVIETPGLEKLPSNWSRQPAPESTRRFGSEWIARGTAVGMRLPSVLISGEWNILLNPTHAGFSKIRIPKPQRFRYRAG